MWLFVEREPRAIFTRLIFFCLRQLRSKRFMNIKVKESFKIATIMSFYIVLCVSGKYIMLYYLGILY